jgi:hypothetical protein
VARACDVSKHPIYAWKAKYGGMEASEAQRFEATGGRERAAEAIKRLVADLSLDRIALKETPPAPSPGAFLFSQNAFSASPDSAIAM